MYTQGACSKGEGYVYTGGSEGEGYVYIGAVRERGMYT